jgi:hypothetical protein
VLTEKRRKTSNPTHGAIVLRSLVKELKAAGIETISVHDIERALEDK